MTLTLASKGATAGESQGIERGLQEDLRALCVKQQSQVFGRYKELQGVTTFLPPLPGPVCWVDTVFVD